MTCTQDVSAILLVGGGGHCRSVIDMLEMARQPIAGIVQGTDTGAQPVLGYPVLGQDLDLPKLRVTFSHALVTVGQIVSPAIRQKLFTLLLGLDFILPTVVSPLAHVSRHASLGAGTTVLHKAVVNAGVCIGNNNIINTGTIIEHDCVTGPHCHIACGAVLCGGVRLGNGSFIGAGSVVRENVLIGSNVIIGCGVTVRHDVPSNTLYYGKKEKIP